MEVVGIKNAMFHDKESGKDVSYCQLHVAEFDKSVRGLAVDVLKIPTHLFEDVSKLNPGDQIKVSYNKFGRVETITREI